jgi:hypothetical protein
MTPKEKAKEIYCKYTDALDIRDLRTTANPFAKRCALIAVDEIEQALTDYGRGDSLELQNMDSTFRYWQEVKQEIENL